MHKFEILNLDGERIRNLCVNFRGNRLRDTGFLVKN